MANAVNDTRLWLTLKDFQLFILFNVQEHGNEVSRDKNTEISVSFSGARSSRVLTVKFGHEFIYRRLPVSFEKLRKQKPLPFITHFTFHYQPHFSHDYRRLCFHELAGGLIS